MEQEIKQEVRCSVVRVPFVVTPWASVKDSATFVGRSQLLCVESHFLVAALLTWLLDHSIGLHVAFRNFLDI